MNAGASLPRLGNQRQDRMAEFADRARYVAQWFRPLEADLKHFSGLHFFNKQFGFDEGKGTDFAGDVEKVVCNAAHNGFPIYSVSKQTLKQCYCHTQPEQLYRHLVL